MEEIKQVQRLRVPIASRVGASEAWGTAAGVGLFSKLSPELGRLPEGTVVVLDYSGIQRTDVSFQREAIVEALKKHRPGLLFAAFGIDDPDVLANLSAALEARSESLLVHPREGPVRVAGRRLAVEHYETLHAVGDHPAFTSAQLTGPPYGLESSTASARLAALWRAGLLGRVQAAAPSGGREYRYYPVTVEDG